MSQHQRGADTRCRWVRWKRRFAVPGYAGSRLRRIREPAALACCSRRNNVIAAGKCDRARCYDKRQIGDRGEGAARPEIKCIAARPGGGITRGSGGEWCRERMVRAGGERGCSSQKKSRAKHKKAEFRDFAQSLLHCDCLRAAACSLSHTTKTRTAAPFPLKSR